MSRVLVTGASGFVGQSVLPLLVARGYEVHGVARNPPSKRGDVEWHAVDLLECGEASALVKRVRPKMLIHLAWQTSPSEFWTSLDNLNWVKTSLDLIQSFAAAGGRRIVVTGTCAEYDLDYGFCSEEHTPMRPATMYGATKHAFQILLDRAAGDLGIEVAWGRLFFLYGPGEPPETFVVSVVTSLLRGELAACTHGRQLRDYLHVADVASALVHLLDSGFTGPVNIASGRPVSLAAIATTAGRLLGREHLVELGALATAPDDPPLIVGDIRRLQNRVGWRPSLDLEKGLQETIEWWATRI